MGSDYYLNLCVNISTKRLLVHDPVLRQLQPWVVLDQFRM